MNLRELIHEALTHLPDQSGLCVELLGHRGLVHLSRDALHHVDGGLVVRAVGPLEARRRPPPPW